MFRLEQDVLLILDVLNLLLLEKEVLVDSLHGIHATHLAIRDEEDFTEAALVNHLNDLEVFKVDLLAVQAWLALQAHALTLVFLGSLAGELLSCVVLFHAWWQQNHEIVEKLVVSVVDPFVATVLLIHDQGLSAIEKEFRCGHASDPIRQVSLRRQIIVKSGRAQSKDLQTAPFKRFMLRCQYAD